MKSLSFATDVPGNALTIAVIVRGVLLTSPLARANGDSRKMVLSIEEKLDAAAAQELGHVVLTDKEVEMLLRIGEQVGPQAPVVNRALNRTLVALDSVTDAIAKKGGK